MDIKNFYQGNYKRYLIAPALIFLIFLALIFVYPGVTEGIDLKGGTNIIVRAEKPLDTALLAPVLEKKYSLTELQVSSVSSGGGSYGLFIQFSENTDIAQAQKLLEEARGNLAANPSLAKTLAEQSLQFSAKFTDIPSTAALTPEQTVDAAQITLTHTQENFQLGMQETIREVYDLPDDIAFQKREIRPSLGESFFTTGFQATLIGFFLVVIVVFISFRELIPSAAIIGALIFDIAGALAGMAIFQIPLSLSTIPALLMMIGYSVDTDILLTSRVLKRKEGLASQRAHDSMITGLTMTFATLGAMAVMITLSYLSQLQVIFEIAAVLLFGIFADIIATWLMNAPVLLWYAEKREGKK